MPVKALENDLPIINAFFPLVTIFKKVTANQIM